jgi:hypothetical protein
MPAVAPSTRSCHLQPPHHTPGTGAWRRLDTVRPRIRLRASSQETSSSPRADCSNGLRRRGRRVLLACSLGGGRAKVHAGGRPTRACGDVTAAEPRAELVLPPAAGALVVWSAGRHGRAGHRRCPSRFAKILCLLYITERALKSSLVHMKSCRLAGM